MALEDGLPTMPTAVFYLVEGPAASDEPERLYGRAAIAAYVDGLDGRLMRSMKSILGSSLLEQRTEVGAGRSVRYHDVVVGYLRHLRRLAEAQAGRPIERAVLGRPVFFVDDDPARDAAAQAALAAAAQAVGLRDLHFQYEPIAAALDYESSLQREQTVLVADIGGGTSDFSLVRVGPERARAARPQGRHPGQPRGARGRHRLRPPVSLAAIMPVLGHGSRVAARGEQRPREVPSSVFFDLATWHLINTVYAPARLAEWRRCAAGSSSRRCTGA